MPDLVVGEDGLARCGWCVSSDLYMAYHDDEWGRPQRDDRTLFEKMSLEAFQSGLAWITILRKRENFRKAFADFDAATVAGFGEKDIDRLLADTGIVRNRQKIEATIHNARVLADLPLPLSDLLWSFAPEPRPARLDSFAEFPATTAESKAMARDLKKRGFRFVGPTTAYALMQAMGMVDDHLEGCHVRVM
ncbi:DNA-3-methyladenine glycosylase I [Virgisporangium ochraceum]|uniref:DNA-3-methyladenine glycosylase I n=1 Tax=Virgisporangium ochraceum TaxID=65505 RepID=UPI001943CE72|nr:DNA-3-methyladenine glycosylase I [Virgisporangium ochraceum]